MNFKSNTDIKFGPHSIYPSQVFIMRKNVFAIIDHKPQVPGHVLVCSRRVVPKLQDLNQIEILDLFVTAQQVVRKMETIYKTVCQMVISNGVDSGQEVPHAHIHVLPVVLGRKEDAEENKGVRVPRSQEDMAKQAEVYRPYFQQSTQ